MSSGPEFELVERPFLDQLSAMGGWKVTTGNRDFPSATGRESFRAVGPDLVLFVNGIPLVVVEAKSPTTTTPLEKAIDQLQHYGKRPRLP
jgi:type I site-specific restriction endonuclease